MTNKLKSFEESTCFAIQCSCGHIILESYKFNSPTEKGCIGFDWCGFCRTRTNIIPRETIKI